MKAEGNVIKIAVVDDHTLLRHALANLINTFENCSVISLSSNGAEFVQEMERGKIPDIVLLDLNMPVQDGHTTALWLKTHFPQVHVLMLSMYDSELTMIRLLQAGAKGFLRKDVEPSELKKALYSVVRNGYYYSGKTADKLAGLFRDAHGLEFIQNNMLSEQETCFLRLACSDLTYKEIAHKMGLSPRQIDMLRDQLFEKLNVKSRVGLAIVALRSGIVNI